MRIPKHFAAAAALLLCGAATAAAQDTRKVGVTMGYPASIGLLIDATDKVAIRPEFTISGGTSEAELSSFTTRSDGWAFGTGVTVLFYLHKYDNLRTYLAPRFTYSRSTTTTETAGVIFISPITGLTTRPTESTSTSTGAAGMFGAHYRLGDRFSVFGEAGFGFAHSINRSSASASKLNGNTWGSRTGVGVIFYF